MVAVYIDHDVSAQIAALLRNDGHDVLTTRERHLTRASDDEQLLVASQQGRVLITHNARDFVLLHNAWRRWSAAWQVTAVHAGILVIPQWPRLLPAEAARELHHFLVFRGAPANELHQWRASARGWVQYP